MKLKHAMGRSVVVPDDQASEYLALGWEVDGETAGPSKAWKVDQLKAYAEEQGIDLGDASKKDEILAAIDEHVAAQVDGETAGAE